jgi:hypothetical protein
MFHEAFESALEELEAGGYDQEYETQSGDGEGFFNETEEMDLAAELLAVASDQELDHFLGEVMNRAAGGRRRGGGLLSALGKALKPLFKQALPIAGGTIGKHFGGPRGEDLGKDTGNLIGKFLRLELEGMSPEDREFEMARQMVRFTGVAAAKAAAAPAGQPVAATVRSALDSAARQVAPGLLAGSATTSRSGTLRQAGRWYRRGGRIVLVGV